jgi:transcriptional regulator with XRE-family HTH domain
MEKETEKILENISLIRSEKNVSLLNLANQVGISRSHLYYIETKRVVPSIDVLVRIAKALGSSIDEFLD